MTSVDLSSIAGVRATLDRGATPSDVAEEVLAQLAHPPDDYVWIATRSPDDLRADAAAIEQSVDPSSPLYGVPFAVKDNVDVAGWATTAGCPDFAYVPDLSASAVERLRAAGALLVGKTNLDQFATGLVGTRSPYGIVRNVVDGRYIAGGSSSGSAVAVANGSVPFALGTDTAGSGRVPAALNGIVGLKPTFGQVPTDGVVPACRSFDCLSVFARSVADASLVLDYLTAPTPTPTLQLATATGAGGQQASHRRVGVPGPGDLAPCAEPVRTAFTRAIGRWTDNASIEPVEVDLAPFLAAGRLLYDGAFVAERYDAVGAFVDAHRDAVDPTVGAIIAGAARFTPADRAADEERLAELRRTTDAVWDDVDVLVLPTVPFVPLVDEVLADPVGVNARLGVYTTFVNLLDLCAMAIPAGRLDDGLPFGVTVIAPAGADPLAARVATALTIPTEIA